MSAALCLLTLLGGPPLARLPGDSFTLSWTHSIEHTGWQEDWRITGDGLVLASARVQGTGAGMEPPADARLVSGWWVWVPTVPPQPRVVLAASGFTADHTLCVAAECRRLHDWAALPAGPVVLEPCR